MNWEAVGVILTAITALLALATAYLRLFVANKLNELREVMERKFVSQEVFELRMKHVDLELATIRRDIERP
jgi:hypothetical protein